MHVLAAFLIFIGLYTGFRTIREIPENELVITTDAAGRVKVRDAVTSIEAMNKAHGRFNEEDQQLLEELAAIAAPAIENALLHTQLQQANYALVQRYDERRETQDQLVTAEKRAATVELAGATAHQLNQPLTVILCSLGMVRNALSPDHAVAEDLDAIEQAVDAATEIVEKIGSITEYRTKTYIEGIRIVDLGASGAGEPEVASLEE